MDFAIDRRELLKATGAGIATVTVVSGTASANLDGSGTESDPFRIRTFEDLLAIDDGSIEDSLTKHYVLEEDIDATEEEQIAPLAFATSSGEDPKDFTGTFDGQGNSIIGLTIDGFSEYDNAGLFGSIAEGGIVRNLDLVDIDVTGDDAVGGVVGEFDGGTEGEIRNVSVSGSVRGGFSGDGGGIVGQMLSGTVVDSSSSADIGGNDNLGGAIGEMNGGEVKRSFSEGNITSEGVSNGGFVGRFTGGTINQSYATGRVSAGSSVGGFAGLMNGGEVNQAYAWGNVEGFEGGVGGFVGFFGDGSIEEVYAVGEVNAEVGGGLVGGVPTEDVGDEPIFSEETEERSIISLQASLDVAYWDEVSTGETDAIGSGSLPLGSNVEAFSTDADNDGKADKMTGDDAPDNMIGFDFDNTWVTITEDGDSIISFGVDYISPDQEEDTEDISIAQEQDGDGYPRFGDTPDQKDCIDRREISRGEEDAECPFDRTVKRGGSRDELDRTTGRGGDDTHRDSATARRDGGREQGRGR